MDEFLSLPSVENVCRLCLSTDEPKFSAFEAQDNANTIATKVQACLSIQITTADRVSTSVCEQCVKSVSQWHEYRESCLQSQEKLQLWLERRLQPSPMVVTIKDEPVDIDFCEDNVEVISETTNDTQPDALPSDATNDKPPPEGVEKLLVNETDDAGADRAPESPPPVRESAAEVYEKEQCPPTIKTEPEECDTDCTIEIESVTGSEFVLNPLAAKEDIVMEADSTQKPSVVSPSKKKLKRGPHTHFRGTRAYKQKCIYCQINLHSKYAFARHMQRFHNADEPITDTSQSQDEEELVEDLEEELVSMEKDAPLTQVQQNIISQLKTFSCYTCQQTFTDRRGTLSHIRQHMPDLRPYTCIACLTEFPDRSLYKLHCGASFECAMKIALVIPKYGEEKYFICNMCLRPMQNRRELLSHLSKHSDKQYEELRAPSRSPPKLKRMTPVSPTKKDQRKTSTVIQPIPKPYKDGDPAFNHICNLCGMIYRYKPNMLKHKELCQRLSPEGRTSYQCVYCGMTFLIFSKFHNHLLIDHKKRDLPCPRCPSKFRSPSDYLAHYEVHRNASRDPEDDVQSHASPGKDPGSPMDRTGSKRSQRHNCALCSLEFSTRTELNEHRNLHLKVKIYSCVICRSMFSSAGTLEIHMKEHGIEDPAERNANSSCVEYESLQDMDQDRTSTSEPETIRELECPPCSKVFPNRTSLKRHLRNVHKGDRSKFSCHECGLTFHSQKLCAQHMQAEHRLERAMHQCPKCPKSFVFHANLNLHYESAHGEQSKNIQQCDICGKVFAELASLKIHRGWHNRINSKMSILRMEDPRVKVKHEEARDHQAEELNASRQGLDKDSRTEESKLRRRSVDARARGEGSKVRAGQSKESSSKIDHSGSSVEEVESNAESGTDESQARGSHDSSRGSVDLERPARARKSFPNAPPARPSRSERSENAESFQCQVCEDKFSDVTDLRNHLWDVHCARNKPEKSFPSDELQCELCRNVFPDRETLKLHLQWHKANPILSGEQAVQKKRFPCETCGKLYSSKKVLWRHRKLHKATTVASIKFQSLARKPMASQYQCTICKKVFGRNQSLQRHRLTLHADLFSRVDVVQGQRDHSADEPKAKRIKVEEVLEVQQAFRKPVTCSLCKKPFATMSILYKHKQLAHKGKQTDQENKQTNQVDRQTGLVEALPGTGADGERVFCSICFKDFSNMKNLRQHRSKKHREELERMQQGLATQPGLQEPPDGDYKLFCCRLCDRHFFNSESTSKHIRSVHKTSYNAEVDQNFHRETNLGTYVVKGVVDRVCPRCKIKYPNNRAMKIHFFKYHDAEGLKDPARRRNVV